MCYDEFKICNGRVSHGRKRALRTKDERGDASYGLPKSTILHYVAQGLLTEPIRTGRNMAYYDPATIDRAKFIKTMQEKYSFPLEMIKKLLASRDEGKDIGPLVELDAVIFGAREGPEMDQKAFERATGLTGEQVAELLAAHLLLPLKDGSFQQSDVDAGRVFASGFILGLRASDLAYYATLAKELVDHEMRLRQRLTAQLPEGEDVQITVQLTRGARLLRNYVIDRIFQLRVAAAKNLKDEKLLS